MPDDAVDKDRRSLEERFTALFKLEQGWDSYNARPIDPMLVEDGLRIAALALAAGRLLPIVVPTVAGGVQLEWHAVDEDLEIEVVSPGRYRVFHRIAEVETELEIGDDLQHLVTLFARFGEDTLSLNQWLLVHNPEGQEVVIPERFVVAAEPDEVQDAHDYDLDLLVDTLV